MVIGAPVCSVIRALQFKINVKVIVARDEVVFVLCRFECGQGGAAAPPFSYLGWRSTPHSINWGAWRNSCHFDGKWA